MQELEPVFNKVARYFSLLSDASRLKVIHAVCNTEQSVTDVMTATGLSQSAVSRHLTHLHLSGVASRRKAGAQALYVISDTTLTEICRTACVSLMARESDELAVASTLQESAAQFMAQGVIDTPIKSVRPERSEGFDGVDSSDPSLRSGRTGSRVSRVAGPASVGAVSRVAAAVSVASAAKAAQ
ncbi:MAG: winged helix-turn-helix transcriptional regulator [Rhizobacter sp.]|nr:winged helix-turn-helix transcriptional regulator [Burkholderiales bacterium]